ncbi:MAG: DUF669 domain-containing protein [Lachnotalea sp.]
MAVDFSKFDEQVDSNVLGKEVEEAKKNGGFEDLPKGKYVVSVEKMEIGATKGDGRPMFTLQCKVKEGEYKGRNVFMNRVIYGNKSEKWDDAKAIASVITILDKLQTSIEPEFYNYSQFVDNVLDIYEEIEGKIEISIDYDAKSFNPISFTPEDVYDVA